MRARLLADFLPTVRQYDSNRAARFFPQAATLLARVFRREQVRLQPSLFCQLLAEVLPAFCGKPGNRAPAAPLPPQHARLLAGVANAVRAGLFRSMATRFSVRCSLPRAAASALLRLARRKQAPFHMHSASMECLGSLSIRKKTQPGLSRNYSAPELTQPRQLRESAHLAKD